MSNRYLTPNPWTPERDRRLIEEYATNAAMSVIAAVLDVSRNAVIGRVHRLRKAGCVDLPHRDVPKNRPRRDSRATNRAAAGLPPLAKAAAKPKPLVTRPRDAAGRLVPATVDLSAVLAGFRNLSIVDLRASSCRAIDGDPRREHGYCGLRCEAGSSYCPAHVRLFYVPFVRRVGWEARL